MRQDQFLDVIDRDEAERRFHAVLDLRPLAAESVQLSNALGRVLAGDIVAPIDVPCFDRSNVDGFAVRAEDTFGAGNRDGRVRAVARPYGCGLWGLATGSERVFQSFRPRVTISYAEPIVLTPKAKKTTRADLSDAPEQVMHKNAPMLPPESRGVSSEEYVSAPTTSTKDGNLL